MRFEAQHTIKICKPIVDFLRFCTFLQKHDQILKNFCLKNKVKAFCAKKRKKVAKRHKN